MHFHVGSRNAVRESVCVAVARCLTDAEDAALSRVGVGDAMKGGANLQREIAAFRRNQMAMQLANVADARRREEQKMKEAQAKLKAQLQSAEAMPAVPVRSLTS